MLLKSAQLTLFGPAPGLWFKGPGGGWFGHPLFLENYASERVGIDLFVIRKIQQKISKIPKALRALKNFDPHRNFCFGKFSKKKFFFGQKILVLSEYSKKFRKLRWFQRTHPFLAKTIFSMSKVRKTDKIFCSSPGGGWFGHPLISSPRSPQKGWNRLKTA